MNLLRLSTFGTERGSKECAKYITVSFLAPKQRVGILDVSQYVSLKHRQHFLVYFKKCFLPSCFFFNSLECPTAGSPPEESKVTRQHRSTCNWGHLWGQALDEHESGGSKRGFAPGWDGEWNEVHQTPSRGKSLSLSFLMDVDVLPLY